MKRVFSVFLILCLMLSLGGCGLFSGKKQAPILFYYQRAEYLFGQENGVIASEERDGAGHITDLYYLLRLYLAGPLDEGLVSPFPAELQVMDIRTGNGTVLVTLSTHLDTLPETRRSIACACLALTCMDISGEDTVTLLWDDTILTLDRSGLTLFDDSAPKTE